MSLGHMWIFASALPQKSLTEAKTAIKAIRGQRRFEDINSFASCLAGGDVGGTYYFGMILAT